jgi:hypothetical protein
MVLLFIKLSLTLVTIIDVEFHPKTLFAHPLLYSSLEKYIEKLAIFKFVINDHVTFVLAEFFIYTQFAPLSY